MAVMSITPTDRTLFARCRRAWDLGSRERRGLEPGDSAARNQDSFADSVREALAVHYFPGMWAWDRTIVAPLVLKAAADAAPFVERYVEWAAGVDDFEPLRVEFDYDSRIPDPSGDGDLAAADGRAAHYQGRADALVVDDHGTHWLLVHRLGPWTDGALLELEEAAPTAAWAWEQTFLDAKVRGVLYNELDHNELERDGTFRRTRRRLSRAAVVAAGERLSAQVSLMVDPAVAVYPSPGEHCSTCPFVAPCRAMQDGRDAEAMLAEHFRARGPDVPREGRLGGSTWGMGRGAMPVRFRSDYSGPTIHE